MSKNSPQSSVRSPQSAVKGQQPAPPQSPITLPDRQAGNHQSPILLFDGVCNLCNGSVQWVIRQDPKGIFRFAALQSEAGQQLLENHQLPKEDFDTVILVDNGQVYTRSDAFLRIFKKLGGWRSLLVGLAIIPRPVRNAIYNFVAKNRYRWFGKQESCMLPTPELKSRFL